MLKSCVEKTHSNSDDTKLEAVLNTLLDGMIIIDARGIILKFNPACQTIFGYSPEDVIGKNVKCLMPEPVKREHDRYIQNYQNTKVPKIIGIGREVEGRREDGSLFPMYLSVGEIKEGGKMAYVGIIRDLTEKHQARARFNALQQEHFHLSRVSAMDQMGTTIAHELNQPLTAVMNYMDAGLAISKNPNPQSDDSLANVMQKASQQAKRAANILSRLRQFIEKGEVDKQSVSPESLLRNSADLIVPLVKQNFIHLTYEIDPSLPPLCVSPVQIQQVLLNVIKNACEAMKDSKERNLTLGARLVTAPVKTIVFYIRDTGTGLNADDMKSLFELFSTRKKDGLGVGLSISRNIIGHHNGTMWVEPNTPLGCCFYIELPVE